MPETLTLTAANAGRLHAIGLDISHILPLLDAGMDEDTAVTIAEVRVGQAAGSVEVPRDAATYRLHRDPELAVRLARAGMSVGDAIRHTGGAFTLALTAEELHACIDHVFPVKLAATWKDTHGDLAGLTELATIDPSAEARVLVRLRDAGATRDDMIWLAAQNVPNRGNRARVERIDDRLGAITDPASRRLLLVLVLRANHTMDAARAIVAAVSDAPWIDTATRFVLDGTDPADAITAARADHAIEQQRTRRIPVSGVGR